jgi:hypothetical protein
MNELSEENDVIGGDCPKCCQSYMDCTCKAEPKLTWDDIIKQWVDYCFLHKDDEYPTKYGKWLSENFEPPKPIKK